MTSFFGRCVLRVVTAQALVTSPPPRSRWALSSVSSDSAFLREFRASELTLAGYVGSVGVMEVSDVESGLGPRRTKTATSTRVRVFLARLNDPRAVAKGEDVRVSLREYSSPDLAEQEIRAHSQLPQGASVVTLLGTLRGEDLEADDTLIEAWVANLRVDPPARGAAWLVFRWAGSRTAAALPDDPPSFLPFLDKKPRWHARLKETMRQALEAVAGLHDAGLAHRSLGLTSLVLDSKQQDKTVVDLSLLVVRLDFLGLSTPATLEAIADDLLALGYAFFELVFSKVDLEPRPDQDTLKRLYADIFDYDMDKFRQYAIDEPAWRPPVDFLEANDRAGWQLLDKMLAAKQPRETAPKVVTLLTARGLLASPFFS